MPVGINSINFMIKDVILNSPLQKSETIQTRQTILQEKHF